MKRRAPGFTLIELALALSLVGVVALLALSATRFAALGLDRISSQAERLEARRTLEETVRRALAGVVVSPLLPNEPVLAGEPEQMAFLTLAEDSGAGLYRVALRVETAGGRRSLVLIRHSLAGPRGDERVVLAPHLVTIRLAYFGTGDGAGKAQWLDRWAGAHLPPLLVRIALDTGDGLPWPPLVVRLWTAGGP